ncbi:hypothetical protein pEaSNUABM11_00172 [Erwinia phage pEa_SNUABM_11]|nr:hypothetical protein pEaSNUABM11_00172 [Erwinia phage pEa_SNUABM_11]
MGPYSYSSLALLCRQVNRDNPDLPYPLSPDNIILLGGPYTTSLGTSGRNTRTILNGKSGAGFVGRREFFYDRLDIGKFFNGITVVFDAPGSSLAYADLLPALNEQYGLGLQATDISNGATKLTNGYTATAVTLTIATTSPAFTGSLSVQWTRLPVGLFPDSGPGTKSMLIGDMQAGYFGIVSGSEMASSLDVFNEILGDDSASSPLINSNLFWLKFAYKGEYLFFPSVNIGNTTWKALYDRGAVYGNDSTGVYPPAGSTLTPQNKIIAVDTSEGTVGFNPRVPTYAGEDWVTGVRSHTGELYLLLGRVFSGSYTAGDWDTLTATQPTLDTTTAFMFLTASGVDGGSVWGTSMSVGSTTYIAKTRNYGWRPFLRLADISNVVFAVKDVKGVAVNRLRAPVLRIDNTIDPNMPVRVENVLGTLLRTIKKPYFTGVTVEPVTAPDDVHPSRPIKPFGVTVTSVFRNKTDLATTNGNLGEFN